MRLDLLPGRCRLQAIISGASEATHLANVRLLKIKICIMPPPLPNVQLLYKRAKLLREGLSVQAIVSGGRHAQAALEGRPPGRHISGRRRLPARAALVGSRRRPLKAVLHCLGPGVINGPLLRHRHMDIGRHLCTTAERFPVRLSQQ